MSRERASLRVRAAAQPKRRESTRTLPINSDVGVAVNACAPARCDNNSNNKANRLLEEKKTSIGKDAPGRG
ncbi:hypothetical protein AWZ03_014177 [Drosophila navojoa]|uniref:Uncharacterized protein n=1 Tax=Drosophila navojoa TaxID=7232 RepID=A0A484ATM1_DRONA|nr:hypothetical protein AWZ03_014177 [Drosophila navojoa]